MSEDPRKYRGWLLSAYRIGSRGEYTGDARDMNNARPDITTSRYGGKGAKEKVIEELEAKINEIEGPIL